jgi:hypothetical protein
VKSAGWECERDIMVDDDIVLVYKGDKIEVTETYRAFEQTKMFPLLRQDNFLWRITACEKNTSQSKVVLTSKN